ncbi:uncharacterized protein LOC103949526 [Pyrus x bretschneideri]|uniref:uncharacterized protein LOC103949526 n=1 Tax=Pyrus x bretschneideri TaxID=225117 RepID=UPI00202E4328|nr:uncharacterized protein LOC103949526 [Pyrus x bretschneideri]
MSTSTQTSALLSAPPPPRRFISGVNRKTGLLEMRRRRRPLTISASSRGPDNYDGRLVDEDMIVLRMRIHDTEMLQEDNHQPPSNWMRWEKQYYAHYNSDICKGVGLLQSQLMNTRPSVALGMLALVTISVPISTAALMFPLLDIFKGILGSGNIHF